MRGRGAWVLVALALAGCESTWNLNGKSDATFKADRDACRRSSEGAMVNVAGTPMRTSDNQAYRQCMESKGYTARQK